MSRTAVRTSLLQRLRAWRLQLAEDLFEQDGLNTVFLQARNVLSGTLIVAAGVNASQHPELVPGLGALTAIGPGYTVFGLGIVLLVLNLYDGLRKLAQRRYPALMRITAALVYVALTVRLVQVIALSHIV